MKLISKQRVIGRRVGAARRLTACIAILGLLTGGCGSLASAGLRAPSASGGAPLASGTSTAPTTTGAAVLVGRWVSAGALSVGRLAPKAVPLGDGRVLVVGDDGCYPEGGGADWLEHYAEIWDPATNRWSAAADLRNARARFAAVALRDGRALIAGGMTSASGAHLVVPYNSYSSAWIFNPRAGAWARAGLLGQARTDPAVAVLPDGRVLVAGGYYAAKGMNDTSVDRPSGDGPVIVLAKSIPGVLADVSIPPPPLPLAPVLSSAELYNPATNTWARTGSMAVARFGASAVTLADGRVLVVGQRAASERFTQYYEVNTDTRAFTVAELYDPKRGRFSLAGRLPTPMVDAALVALPDGGALLIGGHTRPDSYDDLPVRTTLRFDATSRSWSATGQLATARTMAMAVPLRDGRVIVAGGFDAYGPTRTAEFYDPASGTWSVAPSMPTPRAGGAAVALADGSVLIVGGAGAHSHDSLSVSQCLPGVASAVRYVPAG